MDYEKIAKELEEYPMLKKLFSVVRGLEPESIEAITAFAVNCFDEETEGFTPECYRTTELLKGNGYEVELRWVSKVGDGDEVPYFLEGFERANIYCDVSTRAGAGLLKRILTTDFELESIDCVRYDAEGKLFNIISTPMKNHESMKWWRGLKGDLIMWSVEQEQQDMESMLEKKASLPC